MKKDKLYRQPLWSHGWIPIYFLPISFYLHIVFIRSTFIFRTSWEHPYPWLREGCGLFLSIIFWMHRFNSYAHRLTEILLTAFTFTFSPSQAFSSFYRIDFLLCYFPFKIRSISSTEKIATSFLIYKLIILQHAFSNHRLSAHRTFLCDFTIFIANLYFFHRKLLRSKNSLMCAQILYSFR